MTLPKLIAALEAAEGSSREFDHEIARAFGYEIKTNQIPAYNSPRKDGPTVTFMIKDGMRYVIPNYTASLDAALTLMPKGVAYGLHGNFYDGRHSAILSSQHLHPLLPDRISGQGVTPALAMCVAALKARAAAAPAAPPPRSE